MAASMQALPVEAYFAQKLASNEKKIRDRAVKRLKKWLTARSSSKSTTFTEEDLLKIWKGLHYCMWMSDKPLVQEELADNLANTIHCFGDLDTAFVFIDVFFKTMCREWFGIDRLRLDKFMMLFRKFFSQSLLLLKSRKWKRKFVNKFLNILTTNLINGKDDSSPDGLKFHLADIYLEELAKAGHDKLTESQALTFIMPYCQLIAEANNKALVQHVIRRVFDTIINWSDVGLEEEEKEGDEEPKLKINYNMLASILFEYAKGDVCLSRNRGSMYDLVKKFQDLDAGVFPGRDEFDSDSDISITEHEEERALQRLQKMDSVQEKEKKNKKNKKRKIEGSTENQEQEPVKKKKKTKSKEKKESKEMDDVLDMDESVKAGQKPKSAKKRNKPENESKEVKLIENGTNDEIPAKKKTKKNKNKTLQKVNDSTSLDQDSPVETSVQENGDTDEGMGKGKKKKKTKVKEEIGDMEQKQETIDGDTVREETKKKKKKHKNESKPDNDGDEVSPDVSQSPSLKDIVSTVIENGESKTKSKKRKSVGKKIDSQTNAVSLEANETERTSKQENDTPKFTSEEPKVNVHTEMENDILELTGTEMRVRKSKKKSGHTSPFATFEKTEKTPPAFVRKAVSKVKGTAKTEPKRAKLTNTPKASGSAPQSRKRVSFIMSRNMAQEYREHLKAPNTKPFDPSVTPEQGILKTPPAGKKQKVKSNSAKKSKIPQSGKRPKAADFF